ncbi:MAG TPA: site-2 protease family protein [Chloroflexota bacterium]|nr:site-2 protease family protein [Chloroflexota bacterium]
MDSAEDLAGVVEEPGEARALVDAASAVMEIRSVRWGSNGPSGVVGRPLPPRDPAVELRGRLLMDSDRAYDLLSGQFKALGYVLLFRSDGDDHVALGIPGELPTSAGRRWVSVGLFFATLLSVLWVGAEYEGVPDNLLAGWPFALSLLGILMTHEMGHYLVARWQKIPASLPYFIPMPLSLLGTMGAVIQTNVPSRNRRSLLLLGAAGPLAGMVVALPVLFIGLAGSTVGDFRPLPGSFQEGNSLLYLALKLYQFHMVLPSGNLDVFINSVALAGWAGLLVTGLNLIPAGQLDGGHVAYALLGRRARWLNWIVVGVMLALSPLWEGWLLWAGLVLLLGRVHSVPLDDITPLGTREKLLAFACLLLFVLVFIPVPLRIY